MLEKEREREMMMMQCWILHLFHISLWLKERSAHMGQQAEPRPALMNSSAFPPPAGSSKQQAEAVPLGPHSRCLHSDGKPHSRLPFCSSRHRRLQFLLFFFFLVLVWCHNRFHHLYLPLCTIQCSVEQPPLCYTG